MFKLKTALERSQEDCKACLARYEDELKAHEETKSKSLLCRSSHDDQVAKYNNEKTEREMYQKLCETERAQYLNENEQLKSGLVAATALAASETAVREL